MSKIKENNRHYLTETFTARTSQRRRLSLLNVIIRFKIDYGHSLRYRLRIYCHVAKFVSFNSYQWWWPKYGGCPSFKLWYSQISTRKDLHARMWYSRAIDDMLVNYVSPQTAGGDGASSWWYRGQIFLQKCPVSIADVFRGHDCPQLTNNLSSLGKSGSNMPIGFVVNWRSTEYKNQQIAVIKTTSTWQCFIL